MWQQLLKDLKSGEVKALARIISMIENEQPGYEDFLHYFEQTGFTLAQTWGDYQLGSFQREHSERMIFLLKKSELAP